MFDHQRALLSLSLSILGPDLCFAGLFVCIRKTISSHKRASLPLFNAVCVRESKLCRLNADVLRCSSGPLIQVTSHKSVSSSSFITHFPSRRPPLPLSLFFWLDAWGGVNQPTGLKWGRLTADAHTSAQTAHSSVCVCVCLHIICVCVFHAFLCTHPQGNVTRYLEQVDPWQLAPGGIVCVCVCVFVLMVTGPGTLAQRSAGACDSRAKGSPHMSTPARGAWRRHLGSTIS